MAAVDSIASQRSHARHPMRSAAAVLSEHKWGIAARILTAAAIALTIAAAATIARAQSSQFVASHIDRKADERKAAPSFDQLWDAPMDNIFMIKLTYWLSR